MVALVIEGSIEALLSLLGEGVDGITYVTRGDGCLGNLEQPLITKACIAAPNGIDGMGIGGIGDRHAVLQHIHISRGQTYLNFTGTVGTGCIEHHIAVVLLLLAGRIILRIHYRWTYPQEGHQHQEVSLEMNFHFLLVF